MRKARGGGAKQVQTKGRTVLVGTIAVALLASGLPAAAGPPADEGDPSEAEDHPSGDGPSQEANIEAHQRQAGPATLPATDDGVWDRSDEPSRTLRDGSPQQAGLVGDHLDAATAALEQGSAAEPPVFPGAVGLIARDGVIAWHEAHGDAVRYADDAHTDLPEDQQRAMADDTIVDLASLSKLFTALAVMQLVEDGTVDLDQSVADVLPAFAEGGKDEVTVRHLLTHTGGLPAWLPLWSAYDTPEERIEATLTVEPTHGPGETRVYSDLGYIALGELIEAATGQPLDEVIAERITEPLGMDDTGFNPSADLVDRIVATEYQPLPERGMVHGEVHDENAWSLEGVAGHAGLFSTADDLAVLAQTLLNGGDYDGARILEPDTIEQMMAEQLADIGEEGQALGFLRAERWLMDAMTSPGAVGHTGFTGTSLVIDPEAEMFAILLTNRVHPTREGPSVAPTRREVARAAGRAVPVAPQTQNEAWFSGLGSQLDETLDVELELPPDGSELTLDLWFDLPADGELRVEARSDGNWEPLAGTLHAGELERDTDGVLSGYGERRWWDASFDLSDHAGPTELRVSVGADGLGSGRGVYVDRVRVDGPAGPIFHDQNPHDQARWRADGWTRVAD